MSQVQPATKAKFELGRPMLSGAVADLMAIDDNFTKFVLSSLRRHMLGDWGEMTEDDKKENEFSLDKHLRLFSSYSGLHKLWIITEADRSTTTILFPEDY